MKNFYRVIALAAVLLILCGGLSGCDAPALQEDIVILFTNDVHCGSEDGIGYAGLAAYRDTVKSRTPYVTLVDCGDAVQGEFIGTVSDGAYPVEIMNELEYDLAVLGNHEFDYGIPRLAELIGMAEYPYLACNLAYSGNGTNALSAVKPYEILEYGDTSVGFVGVATPESIAKSTPSYFMENGEYVYDFADGDNGEELYALVQSYVDECRDSGADYIVVLSHLGDAEGSSPFTSVELIQHTDGIDAVLDGHAHNVIPCRVEQNEAGEDVLLSSTGTKLNNIGQLVITAGGTVTVGLISDYAVKSDAFEAYYAQLTAGYEAAMTQTVATTDIALSGYDENGIRLVRNRETVIGNFCADAYRAIAQTDIAFVNGGGIRDDLPAGNITYADVLAVHPFGNTLCSVKATGQEILDCLEVSCSDVQADYVKDGQACGEKGSFQQVSGLKFTVDTSIPSSVAFDEDGMFVSVDGPRRVKEVMVLDDSGDYVPLDADAEYTVASHNHLLVECGGGINVFADNEFIIAEGMSDYQVLTDYITEYLDGSLGALYADVQGRITIE